MGLGEHTDFEELSARIRTRSDDASGSDTERVTYRSLEEIDVDALRTLIDAFDGDADDSVFVLSTTNAEILLETSGVDEREDLEDRLGREVRDVERMPDDTVLLLDPDAVDGERVVDPAGIACGMVGSADEPESDE